MSNTLNTDIGIYVELDEVNFEAKCKTHENPCYQNSRTMNSKSEEADSEVSTSQNKSKPKVICICIAFAVMILLAGGVSACFVFASINITRLKSAIATMQETSSVIGINLANSSQRSMELIQMTSSVLNDQYEIIQEMLNTSTNISNQKFAALNDQYEENQRNLNQLTDKLNQYEFNQRRLIDKLNRYEFNQRRSIDKLNQYEFNQRILNKSVNQLNQQLQGLHQRHSPASCVEILQLVPSSPSGHYWIWSSKGSAVRVYCDMTRSCNNIAGGWMRVAELDMRDSSSQCPSALRNGTDCPVQTCIINTDGPNCSSVIFASHGFNYSRVCGMIRAYQKGVIDSILNDGQIRGSPTIDSNYVDGISLTYGESPRQHIWTLGVGIRGTIVSSLLTLLNSFY